MDHFPLHDVFGTDGVELRANDSGGARIFGTLAVTLSGFRDKKELTALRPDVARA
jgi:hypothetical protein